MSTLSPAGTAAVTAVDLADPADQYVWFTTLVTTIQAAPAAGLDDFATAFTDAAASAGVRSDAVAELLLVLEQDSNATDTLAELAATGVDTLMSIYSGLLEAGEPAVHDEAAWTAALHELGARWDRTEGNWVQFRDWFLYECAARGMAKPASEFVAYAESRDKAATFAEYQVPLPVGAEAQEQKEEQAAEVSEYPELGVGDSGDWVAYAERMLAQAGY